MRYKYSLEKRTWLICVNRTIILKRLAQDRSFPLTGALITPDNISYVLRFPVSAINALLNLKCLRGINLVLNKVVFSELKALCHYIYYAAQYQQNSKLNNNKDTVMIGHHDTVVLR